MVEFLQSLLEWRSPLFFVSIAYSVRVLADAYVRGRSMALPQKFVPYANKDILRRPQDVRADWQRTEPANIAPDQNTFTGEKGAEE